MKKKCVFIGETGTGKTSILHRIMKNDFEENPMSTNTPSNNCIYYSYKETPIKLELWDTAGQEKFRAVNKLFYKGADICFLVYTVDNLRSFNELKIYWVPTIQSLLGENTALCVVANKMDLFDKSNAIDESEGKIFADSINGSFISVSAKFGFGFPEILDAGLEAYYNSKNKSQRIIDPPKPEEKNTPHNDTLSKSIKLSNNNDISDKKKDGCFGSKNKSQTPPKKNGKMKRTNTK